jgi:hypothetical protein
VTLLTRGDWRVVTGGLITIGSLAGHLNVTLTRDADMSVVSAQHELPSKREP